MVKIGWVHRTLESYCCYEKCPLCWEILEIDICECEFFNYCFKVAWYF